MLTFGIVLSEMANACHLLLFVEKTLKLFYGFFVPANCYLHPISAPSSITAKQLNMLPIVAVPHL